MRMRASTVRPSCGGSFGFAYVVWMPPSARVSMPCSFSVVSVSMYQLAQPWTMAAIW
jgi:hypothetical protein